LIHCPFFINLLADIISSLVHKVNQANRSVLAADAYVLAVLGKLCFPHATMSAEINALDFFVDTILPYLHYAVETGASEVLGV